MLTVKKILLAPLAGLLVWTAAVAAAPAPAPQKSVAVTAIAEHPALDAVREGVRQGLKLAGYEAGKNLKWQYQNAQSNPGTAAQIARRLAAEHPDAIVAIATASAQAAVEATKDVPVVYAAVNDPVAAQLVPGMQPSGTNVTGVSDMLATDRQVDLIRRVVPSARRVGLIYNPGEPNSVAAFKQMQDVLAKAGMVLVDVVALRPDGVGAAARNLISRVDAIYTISDSNVIAAYDNLVKVANDARIPLIASDTDLVRRGAIAALGINYYDLGVQAGRMTARVLKGEKPGSIASETSSKLELFLNPSAAAKQGVVLPPELLKSAAQIVK
jgi:putative ABC transport system substrate-binding protein